MSTVDSTTLSVVSSSSKRRPKRRPPPTPTAIVAVAVGELRSDPLAAKFGRLFDRLDRNRDEKLTPREIVLALGKDPLLAAELGLSSSASSASEGASGDALLEYFREIDVGQDDGIGREEFVRFQRIARVRESSKALAARAQRAQSKRMDAQVNEEIEASPPPPPPSVAVLVCSFVLFVRFFTHPHSLSHSRPSPSFLRSTSFHPTSP